MRKIRNNRNPRYQEALNLAQENNEKLEKQIDHNYQTVLNLADIDSEITRVNQNVKKIVLNILPRNERLTDAFIKMSGKYSNLVNVLSRREDRLDLLEKELKNYVPDHWLFAEDDLENNTAEAVEDEPEPEQAEFNFGEDSKKYERKLRKPN
tara:strand:+ start:1065 stop:1520 length:456 start_codon:yes stop_codon:yes gene_type:complete